MFFKPLNVPVSLVVRYFLWQIKSHKTIVHIIKYYTILQCKYPSNELKIVVFTKHNILLHSLYHVPSEFHPNCLRKSNHLSDQILEFWMQSDLLKIFCTANFHEKLVNRDRVFYFGCFHWLRLSRIVSRRVKDALQLGFITPICRPDSIKAQIEF